MYDNKDIIIIVSDKADLWGPYIVYKETNLRGPHIHVVVCKQMICGGPV